VSYIYKQAQDREITGSAAHIGEDQTQNIAFTGDLFFSTH
jgi:hypothetical protein